MSGNKTQAGRNALGIKYFTKGPPALISRLNEILRGMDALMLRNSGDILGSVTPDGTFARLRTSQISAKARTAFAPFAIIPVPDEDKVTIWPGDLEGIIPTIGGLPEDTGVLLNADPAPQLTVVTGPIYFECTMDAAGVITAVELKNDTTVPANTPTLRYRQIGTVSVVMGPPIVVTVTAQTVTTSVSHKLCAGLSTWGQA